MCCDFDILVRPGKGLGKNTCPTAREAPTPCLHIFEAWIGSAPHALLLLVKVHPIGLHPHTPWRACNSRQTSAWTRKLAKRRRPAPPDPTCGIGCKASSPDIPACVAHEAKRRRTRRSPTASALEDVEGPRGPRTPHFKLSDPRRRPARQPPIGNTSPINGDKGFGRGSVTDPHGKRQCRPRNRLPALAGADDLTTTPIAPDCRPSPAGKLGATTWPSV